MMASNQTYGSKGRLKRRELLLGSATVAALAVGYGLFKGGQRLLTARPGNDLAPVSKLVPTRIAGNDSYPVWYRRPLPLDSPPARYPGFRPQTKLLKAGTLRRKGAMPLPTDILFERDVAVKLRDGTTIYADVFRPAAPGRYPVVMAWSPYGKEIGGQWLDDIPYRANVPLAEVSELQKFEGPDPAFYCAHGYIVLNPDARGAYASEGNINFWGRQVAEDGYDVIEWAAIQPWSDGKIAMAGNSWLAISQWFIAAARPPHLAAIAPWEGADGKFHPGGVPIIGFDEIIIQSFAGKNLVEDVPRMIAEHPLMDAYWQDKQAAIEQIEIPAYVVASYTNMAHTQGTFDAFRRLRSKKWLRVHNTQEWQDFNNPVHRADLLRFFDHVLKGVDNGWDATPPVRLAVLDPGGEDILDRPEQTWPLARQRNVPLYLRPDQALSTQAATGEATVAHDVTDAGGATFELVCDRDTEITGYMGLRLWVQADGSNDMDIAVAVEKLDPNGKSYPAPGPPGSHITATGLLRVSHRELDIARSTPAEPVQTHQRELLLKPGEIIPVDIAIWPIALMCHKGERLSLKITAFGAGAAFNFPFEFGSAPIPVPADGGTFAPDEAPNMIVLGGLGYSKPEYCFAQAVRPLPTRNKGRHVIHLGGRYDSRLIIPVIPA